MNSMFKTQTCLEFNQTGCFPTALTVQKNTGTLRIPKWKNWTNGITIPL